MRDHEPGDDAAPGAAPGGERPRSATVELLLAAARLVRHAMVERMRAHDVTPAQARALRVVGTAGGLRPSSLAERLEIAPRSATEVVDALQARGLVRREPDPDDRRATRVVITGEGARVGAALDEARDRASASLLERLEETDRRELERILRLLVHAPDPTA